MITSICELSSTAQGGGVPEMLPKMVGILRELGVDAQWIVRGSDDPAFFKLTKRIHNMIHGMGDPSFSDADRNLYETVSRAKAHSPVLTLPFPFQAQRLQPSGEFSVATIPNESGLLYRPVVSQISR